MQAMVAWVTVCFFCWAASASAQPARTYRVAYLAGYGDEWEPFDQTFRSTLTELGYVEGRNLVLDLRRANRDLSNVRTLATELVASKPDVLLAWQTAAQMMHEQTKTIPIVIYGTVDPVGAGLAESLRRPGKNVTGVAQHGDQLPAKHIELMREIKPGLKRIGLLVDEGASGCPVVLHNAKRTAASLGLSLVEYRVSRGQDIEQIFARMERDPPEVLIPCPSILLFNYRDVLLSNALRLRIPVTSFVVESVPDGVLFAYASSVHETRRGAALYVDKILKGARPGDLPIQQPTNFELVLNLKTAKAVGLPLPPSMFLRASRVVQ